MNVVYNLYIRFMVWLGATPPPGYEELLAAGKKAEKQIYQETPRTPGWLRVGLVIIIALIALVVASLLLLWVQSQVPLGDRFTLKLAGEEAGRVETVYDVLEHRQYRLAYSVPPTLQISIQPTGTVQVTLEGQNEKFSRAGEFTLSLSDLVTDINPVTDTYHILAEGPRGSRRDLWLIYRPGLPYLDRASLPTRTLSATLFPGYVELRYHLTLPVDIATIQPVVADLRQGHIGVPVFLKWTYYPGLEEDGFTGQEFTELKGPKYHLTDNEQTIEISATLRGGEDYTDNLNRLLGVSRAPGPVLIEIQTEAVEIAQANPWPDEITDSHWLWRKAPVEVGLNLSDSVISTEALGSHGLAWVRKKLDDLGRNVTIILILLLPLLPFAWWALLAIRGVTAGVHGWPIWLGVLFWLAPLILFVVHRSPIEMGYLAMASTSVALGILALGSSAGRSAGWLRRLLWIGAATLAVPLVALGAQFGLRNSSFVAVACSLVLLGIIRLTARSFWPDRPIPWRTWVLVWAATLPLTYPVPISALGFSEGVGWSFRVWPPFYLVQGVYVLPYIVLAMTLRLLRDRERELSAEPSRLMALGKLMFVFFLVGGTRGLTPGLPPVPSVYPIAFVLALLLVYRWLVPDGKDRLQDLARRRDAILQRRAELIQAALDIQWARKALNQLLQREASDPEAYEEEKKPLEKYLAERQRGVVLDQPVEREKADAISDQQAVPEKVGAMPDQKVEPEKAVFACGPYAKAWDNGLLGGRRALFIGAWLLMIYLRSVGDQVGVLDNPFLLFIALVVFLLPLLIKWVLLGFFLGYFFPYIRGDNGWQKGLYLALAIAACTVPHDLLNGEGLAGLPAIGLDVVQNVLLLTILGLWAFDYETLHQHGHGWRRLLIVYNMTFLTGYGTSVVAALGSTIVGLLTGRLEPVLKDLIALLVPGGQPPM